MSKSINLTLINYKDAAIIYDKPLDHIMLAKIITLNDLGLLPEKTIEIDKAAIERYTFVRARKGSYNSYYITMYYPDNILYKFT